jgi:hypothetical protein
MRFASSDQISIQAAGLHKIAVCCYFECFDLVRESSFAEQSESIPSERGEKEGLGLFHAD